VKPVPGKKKPWIRAIPTMYKGVTYRSRFEADTVCFLDHIGYTWQYEPEPGFLLDNGEAYRPDLWVEGQRCWYEPRGYRTDEGERQIAGFRKWIAEGRIGPAMLPPTRPPNQSKGFPKGVMQIIQEMPMIDNRAAWYIVIRPDSQPELFTNIQKEPLPVAFTFCKECQKWTLWTFTAHSLFCRHCRAALDPDDRLLISLEGHDGYLTVVDPLGSSLARRWCEIWEERLSRLEDMHVVRCANYSSCRRSDAVYDPKELPLGWIKFEEHLKPSSEGESPKLEKKYYCSNECFLRRFHYLCLDGPDDDIGFYSLEGVS
jgi:hypothetical protein